LPYSHFSFTSSLSGSSSTSATARSIGCIG
jgi:hypothetical protein